MKEDIQNYGMFVDSFDTIRLWHNVVTVEEINVQRTAVKIKGLNDCFLVKLTRYRHCEKNELYRFGENGESFPIALYNGCLYNLRNHYNENHELVQDVYELTNLRKCVYLVHRKEIDDIYAGCFAVQYKQRWYRCDMIGGANENAVSVVVADPHENTGLSSPHNTYMWGNGVEINHDQIESVRLYISDSIAMQFWA